MLVSKLSAYLLVFLSGLAVTLLLTPLVRKFAHFFNILDRPGPRRVHKNPVPRLGGVAVFLGFHIAAALLLLPAWSFDKGISMIDASWWVRFLPVSGFLLIVGLVDDIFSLSARVKFALQTLAAILLYISGIHAGVIMGMQLPMVIDIIITVVWVLAFVNAFNLIDGLDGLASGLGGIAAFGLVSAFLLRDMPIEAGLMLGFMASCLGFLRYNFNPASIFLGDSGSMFLGFTIASIALTASSKGALMASIGVPLLAVGVPIFDAMLAVWRRSVRAARPTEVGQNRLFNFDLEHLHHRLLKSGLQQRKIAFILYAVNAALIALGLLSMIFTDQAWGIFVLASMLAIYVIVKHVVYVELWDSGIALLNGFRQPSNQTLATILYPIFDFAALSIAFLISLGLSRGLGGVSVPAEIFAIWIGITFISLFATKTYSRVWSRARISEFFLLSITLVAAGLLGSVFGEFFGPKNFNLKPIEVGMYVVNSLLLLSLLRILPRLLRELLVFSPDAWNKYDKENVESVIVYGAGEHALLYLKHFCLQELSGPKKERVIALVDDDLNLRGRRVFDLPVIGSIRDLNRFLNQHRGKIKKIVLTANLSERRFRRLTTLAKRNSIDLIEWKISEVLINEGRGAFHAGPSLKMG